MLTKISGLVVRLYANGLLTSVKYDKRKHQRCGYKEQQATSILLSSVGFNILVKDAAV
jgi:hypothetical protein